MIFEERLELIMYRFKAGLDYEEPREVADIAVEDLKEAFVEEIYFTHLDPETMSEKHYKVTEVYEEPREVKDETNEHDG